MLNTFTLKNGLKVATYSIPQMRSVYVSQSVKSGNIFDTPKNSGAAHFMEHLLVQGIPSLPNVEVFTDFVESLAGSYNATTSTQVIKFNINAPSRHIKEILQISSEVFFQPLFNQEAVERERRAVLEEIRQRQDALWYKNWKFFTNHRFAPKNHPMKLDGGGNIQTVQTLQKADLVSFWDRFFHPNNTYLVITGGFKPEEIRKLLEEHYGKIPKGKNFVGYPKLSNQDLTDRVVAIRTDQSLQTCYVDLSFPTLWDRVPIKDRVIHRMISGILGGFRSSRLFRLLRQQRGLVYDVSFNSGLFDSFGYADISFQAVPENLEEVLGLSVKELKGFVAQGATQQELQFAKNYLTDRIMMQFDHPSAISDWIEGDLLWEDKIYTPEEIVSLIETVSEADLKQVMEKYWNFDKLNLTIQGSVEDLPKNINKFSDIIFDL